MALTGIDAMNGVSDKHKSHQHDPEHMRNTYKNCSLRNQTDSEFTTWGGTN